MRLTVRVQPGARQTRVGGRYGDREPPILVVRVAAPAIDGRANRAVIDALAAALHVRRNDVRIIFGESTRTKLVEVTDADPILLRALLDR
jgi:uncharacterized protein (TIGR00251 family)